MSLSFDSLVGRYSEHLDWYVEKLHKAHRRSVLLQQLRLAEAVAMATHSGTKKGNDAYQRWHRSKVDELESLDESELTVFEKLRGRRQTGKTVFDKLKYLRRN